MHKNKLDAIVLKPVILSQSSGYVVYAIKNTQMQNLLTAVSTDSYLYR